MNFLQQCARQIFVLAKKFFPGLFLSHPQQQQQQKIPNFLPLVLFFFFFACKIILFSSLQLYLPLTTPAADPCDQIWRKIAALAKVYKSWANFWQFILIWQTSEPTWQICDIIGLIFIVANGQILKNNLVIWLHCDAISVPRVVSTGRILLPISAK